MKLIEVNLINTTVQRSSPCRRTSETSSILTTSWDRTNEQIRSLIKNLPKPPLGFDFSMDQRQQQAQFFKFGKDHIIPRDNVDLYDADIVAICI
jgi:hypothetical protein